MIAIVLDTITGKTAISDGVSSWQWAEGNFSCDCNRDLWGNEESAEECVGCKRYLVIQPIFLKDEELYSLEELNSGYPEDLLEKFLKEKS